MSVPDLPPGTVLHLDRADWKYGTWALILRVETVRGELSRYYPGTAESHVIGSSTSIDAVS